MKLSRESVHLKPCSGGIPSRLCPSLNTTLSHGLETPPSQTPPVAPNDQRISSRKALTLNGPPLPALPADALQPLHRLLWGDLALLELLDDLTAVVTVVVEGLVGEDLEEVLEALADRRVAEA